MLHVQDHIPRIPEIVARFETRLEICSRCGRPGLERWTREGRVCVHEELLEMMSDGLLVTPVDACPLEPFPGWGGEND